MDDRTAETEIALDPRQLLGFETLPDLGADAAALREALDATHNKIGGGEVVLPDDI